MPSTISVRFDHAHRQRALDELAVAAARLARACRSPPICFANARASVGVGLVGDQQQVVVLGDRAAEQPLARLGVVEQPVAQVLRGRRSGTSSRIASPPDRGLERQHGLLGEARADRVRDRVQLVVVERGRRRTRASARTWSSRREKNTPSSSSEPRARAPPSSMIRSTSRAKPFRRSCSRGSAGSVITAVLLVAKISASSSCAAAVGASNASALQRAGQNSNRFHARARRPRGAQPIEGNPPADPLHRGQAARQLDPRAHAELRVDARERALDRLLAQEQLGRDLLVRASLDDELGDVALAVAERLGPDARPARRSGRGCGCRGGAARARPRRPARARRRWRASSATWRSVALARSVSPLAASARPASRRATTSSRRAPACAASAIAPCATAAACAASPRARRISARAAGGPRGARGQPERRRVLGGALRPALGVGVAAERERAAHEHQQRAACVSVTSGVEQRFELVDAALRVALGVQRRRGRPQRADREPVGQPRQQRGHVLDRLRGLATTRRAARGAAAGSSRTSSRRCGTSCSRALSAASSAWRAAACRGRGAR